MIGDIEVEASGTGDVGQVLIVEIRGRLLISLVRAVADLARTKVHLRVLRERLKIDDSSTGVVTREDIEEVVARWTGIAVTSIKEDEQQKLLRIEEELHRRIISQEKAISALARAIRRSRAGLKSPKRPAGSFLFL